MFKRFSKLAGVTFCNASNGEFRQRIIRDLSRQGMLENGTCLIPLREPNNPYDPNAVAVCALDGRQLGYLRKEDAAQVAEAMDSGANCKIMVNGVTGGDAENVYGVNIIIQIEENNSDDLLQSKNLIEAQNRAPSAVKFNLESEVKSADADFALGEGWKRAYPQYEQFAKKVSNSPFLIFITNIHLYLYNTNDGHFEVLTSNNQRPLACDIQRSTVFALVCDYSTGTEVCNLLEINIGTDASIRKEVLLSLPSQVSEECKSFLFCVDNLVFFSTGCINAEYSFASFNIETEDLRYFSTLADYEIKECVANNSTAWLIAVNKEDYGWPPKHFLYYWNIRTNECRPILEAETITSLIVDKGSKYCPTSIPQVQANTIVRFCIQEDSQQAIKYIVAEEAVRGQVKIKTDDKNAYWTDKYKISFVEHEECLSPEDGSMFSTHIESYYRYSKVLSCQTDLDQGVSCFCVVDDELYICYQGSWFWNDDGITMVNLANKGIPVDLIINGLSIPERELASRLESSVTEEYYAIETWAKAEQPINPTHKKICDELSKYEVFFGNVGACHIKNCATRARPIVQICLADGTEKTYLADAFKNSISVKGDDGVQLLRIKQLIDDALIIPEKTEKEPFKSINISWGAAFEGARKVEVAISSEGRNKRSDRIAKGEDDSRGRKNQERIDFTLLHQERIIKDVSMYVILDNEKILGYHNRPSKTFFEAYRDFFSPLSEEELNNLRLKIQINSAQKQYQDYYNSVLSQQSLSDRFKMIVLNLYNELDSCDDVHKRAQFAVSNTRKWFLRAEYSLVDKLMETELDNLKNRLIQQIGVNNPAWRAYETARPYLEISRKEYLPGEEFGSFAIYIDFNTYVVQLRSNESCVELSNSMAWAWDTTVSEVWKDALFNTLLKREVSCYDCRGYCSAVARATVKFG